MDDFDDDDFEDIVDYFENSELNVPSSEHPNESHLEILKTRFGHGNFRPMQWKVIRSILVEKRDNCVIMATGYGKSLCYQFPSVYARGITLVISPLISLMEDQVRLLTLAKIPACFLGSAQSDRSILTDIYAGVYRVVYLTPEYITGSSDSFLKNIESQLVLIGIDEAHCVSQWGQDFRPAFRSLWKVRELVPNVPILAVTATATERVKNDIITSLKLKNPQVLCTGFDRPNLQFSVKLKGDYGIWSDLNPYLSTHSHGSAIIYCITKKTTDAVATILKGHGIKCEGYHAGISIKERRAIHEKFARDQIHVIVATVAFGMGIDKPDVRMVIHYGAPKDIESYYQEVGRAGRDGLPAKCVVFYETKDFAIHLALREKLSSQTVKNNQAQLSKKMYEFLESRECRRLMILKYFEGNDFVLQKRPKNCCDNCSRRTNLSDDANIYDDIDENGLYDFTDDAVKLIEAIQVFKGNTGLGYPILLLRGSRVKKLNERYYSHRLHGAGKSKTDDWWKAMAQLLERKDFLKKDVISGGFANMQKIFVTSKGADWVESSENCPLKLKPSEDMYKFLKKKRVVPQYETVVRATSSAPRIGIFNNNVASNNSKIQGMLAMKPANDLTQKMRKALLEARGELANMLDGVPYMIASNTALTQMAKLRPKTLDQMRMCNLDGFSEVKLTEYGPFFLKIIRQNSEDESEETTRPVDTLEEVAARYPLPGTQLTNVKKIVHQMWTSGMSVDEIAKEKGIVESTVFAYLTECIKCGLHFTKQDLEKVGIDDHIHNQIISKFPADILTARLKEIKDKLPPLYSYDMIRLVLAYHQIRQHLKSSNIAFIDPDEQKSVTIIQSQSINSTKDDQEQPTTSARFVPKMATSTKAETSTSDFIFSSDDEDMSFEEIDEAIFRASQNSPKNDNDAERTIITKTEEFDDDDDDEILQMEAQVLKEMRKMDAQEHRIHDDDDNSSTDMEDNFCDNNFAPSGDNPNNVLNNKRAADTNIHGSSIDDEMELSENFLQQIDKCETEEIAKISSSQSPPKKPVSIKDYFQPAQSTSAKKKKVNPNRRIKYENSSDEENDAELPLSPKRPLPSWLSSSASGTFAGPPTAKRRKNIF